LWEVHFCVPQIFLSLTENNQFRSSQLLEARAVSSNFQKNQENMKLKNTLILLFFITFCSAQKKETIKIPKGIVYNYCDSKIVEKAKQLISENLSDNNDYKILQANLIIGPELWKRFKDNESIQKTEKGKV
jgi:hypothetical protein